MSKLCKEKDCSKEVRCRGLCINHYMVARRSGAIETKRKPHKDKCACGKKTSQHSTMCSTCAKDHSEKQNRLKGVTCKAGKCESHRIEGGGYCQKHYQQFRKTGRTFIYGRLDINEVEVEGDVTAIYCRNSRSEVTAVTIIDTSDLPKVSGFKWGYDRTTGYVTTQDMSPKAPLQRVVMGVTDSALIVDHKSGNKLDNRKQNLRKVTVSQNAMNSRSGLGSKYSVPEAKGVFYSKTKQVYVAKLAVQGKIYSKTFKDKDKAIAYRQYLALRYHGEHAFESRYNEISTSI